MTGDVLKIIRANHNRRVMAPVPIHVEAPEFLYFGLGYDGKGSFQSFHYNLDGKGGFNPKTGDGNLYFWFNPAELPEYNFPLLLGVREDQK